MFYGGTVRERVLAFVGEAENLAAVKFYKNKLT